MQVDLSSPVDVLGFRAQANSLLAQQVPPADIDWKAAASLACGENILGAHSRPSQLPSALHAIVPRSFVRLTELVVLHRDPRRFELLYRLLWRLVHEPELTASGRDADVAQAQSMAQAVRRDILRTRKAVRLRVLPLRDGIVLNIGWCEPQHHVTEEVAQVMSGMSLDQPWLLASPDRCLLWNGEHLLCGPGVPAATATGADDAHWYEVASRINGGPLVPVQ
jgi:probable DNA metabolism protein